MLSGRENAVSTRERQARIVPKKRIYAQIERMAVVALVTADVKALAGSGGRKEG